MRSLYVTEVFRRLGIEIPGVGIRWTSVLESDALNVVYAEGILRPSTIEITNAEGRRAYGDSLIIQDVPSRERIRKVYVHKSVVQGLTIHAMTLL